LFELEWKNCLLIGTLKNDQYDLIDSYLNFCTNWRKLKQVNLSLKIFLRNEFGAEIVFHENHIFLEFPSEEIRMEFLLTYS